MDIEKVILSRLVHDEAYGRKVMPFLRAEYFSDHAARTVFETIRDYSNKYSSVPTIAAVSVELSQRTGITEKLFADSLAIASSLAPDGADIKWVLDQTEGFCRDRAIFNALLKAESAYSDPKGKIPISAIPELLTEALAVGFDDKIGHDYLGDAEDRFDSYHEVNARIPFDIELMNRITNGGMPRKTLSVILAPTGVGKSLIMGHQAAANLMAGRNVLYVTLELSEEMISRRIDANLMNVDVQEILSLSKESYVSRIQKIRERTVGKLYVKEYPSASVSVANIRALIKELALKKSFVPDVVYVDYINLLLSSRFRGSHGENSYTIVKAVAEELRGLAVEGDFVLVTATQTTRSGLNSSDVGLVDTSESIGVPYTADFMYSVVQTEELKKLGQYLFTQLKNRYGDPNRFNRFIVGVNMPKMKLYNVDEPSRVVQTSPQAPSPQPPASTDLKSRFSGLS